MCNAGLLSSDNVHLSSSPANKVSMGRKKEMMWRKAGFIKLRFSLKITIWSPDFQKFEWMAWGSEFSFTTPTFFCSHILRGYQLVLCDVCHTLNTKLSNWRSSPKWELSLNPRFWSTSFKVEKHAVLPAAFTLGSFLSHTTRYTVMSPVPTVIVRLSASFLFLLQLLR